MPVNERPKPPRSMSGNDLAPSVHIGPGHVGPPALRYTFPFQGIRRFSLSASSRHYELLTARARAWVVPA